MLGLYDKVSNGGKVCKSCWVVPGKVWYTERHHRETPYRIEHGQADVGIVWTTEVVYAKREGRPIDGVAIPAPYNMSDRVGYAIGSLKTGQNKRNAKKFLKYLATDDAQAIYESHGFVQASKKERKVKRIP